VIALGGGSSVEALSSLCGAPLVVDFAPQPERQWRGCTPPSIASAGGVARAADIVKQAISTGQPML
jgi:hypothetical protein